LTGEPTWAIVRNPMTVAERQLYAFLRCAGTAICISSIPR
jgi:hypothetical protein